MIVVTYKMAIECLLSNKNKMHGNIITNDILNKIKKGQAN